MPSPQWIVGGSYQKGRRMNGGKWSETDIELLLINAEDGSLRRDVFREKAGNYNEARFVSDHIAQKLNLTPRKVAVPGKVDRKNETWAILPLFDIMTIKDFDNSKKFSGTDFFIYQILQSGNLKNIVMQ